MSTGEIEVRATEVRALAPEETPPILVAYGAEDARQIIGRKSSEIEAILGYRGRDEMIHRDDLVMGREAKG